MSLFLFECFLSVCGAIERFVTVQTPATPPLSFHSLLFFDILVKQSLVAMSGSLTWVFFISGWSSCCDTVILKKVLYSLSKCDFFLSTFTVRQWFLQRCIEFWFRQWPLSWVLSQSPVPTLSTLILINVVISLFDNVWAPGLSLSKNMRLSL